MNLRIRDVINPFTFAVSIFFCPPRDADWITGTGYARSILGTLLTVYFSLPYMTDGEAAGSLMDNWFETAIVSGAIIVVAAVPLSVLSSRMGRAYFRKFGWQAPCRAIAYCSAAGLLFSLAYDGNWWLKSPIFFTIPFILIWLAPFIIIGVFLNSAFVFGVGETHPQLAPLVSTVTVTILGVRSLSEASAAPTSKSLTLLIVLSGIVSTIVLSAIEFYILSKKGYSLRRAPRTYAKVTKKNLAKAREVTYNVVTIGMDAWINKPEK